MLGLPVTDLLKSQRALTLRSKRWFNVLKNKLGFKRNREKNEREIDRERSKMQSSARVGR